MVAIYMDGSFRKNTVGFGVRVEYQEGHEHYGAKHMRDDGKHSEESAKDINLHEAFAYVEAALVARNLGLLPDQCHFITDDRVLVDGVNLSSKNGFSKRDSHRKALLTQISKVGKYYSHLEVKNAITYLESRFTKIKGHDSCVNNLRVDYLASIARRRLSGSYKDQIEPMVYDKWLMQGLSLQGMLREISGQKYGNFPFCADHELDERKFRMLA